MTKNSFGIQPQFILIWFDTAAGTTPASKSRHAQIVKHKLIITGMLAAAIVAVGAVGCASEKSEPAELQAQARISKDQAQQTALAKVPNGTVKEAELEKEKGKLIWSFGIATPDSNNITEVNVDAITGDIVNVEQETPQTEAKEKD
jgi:uncharacterized membrane protein YkoI